MGKRLSRWVRNDIPGNMVLQARDKKILTCVYSHRIMTREQIQTVFKLNCIRKANNRLRKLYDHHYLSRKFLPTIKGSPKALYFLGPRGFTVIAEELGIDLPEIKQKVKETSRFKELFLRHTLQIIETRIAFTSKFLNQPGSCIQAWINEDDLQQEYTVLNNGKSIVRRFRPDGYFRVLHEQKIYGHFLELDRSTMSHAKFKSKVETYLEFSQLGLYRERFGMKYFRVLVITLTEERLLNLKKLVESITDKFFWFTSLNQIASRNPLDPIWMRAGFEGTFPMFRSPAIE
jgi:hypothetical protein